MVMDPLHRGYMYVVRSRCLLDFLCTRNYFFCHQITQARLFAKAAKKTLKYFAQVTIVVLLSVLRTYVVRLLHSSFFKSAKKRGYFLALFHVVLQENAICQEASAFKKYFESKHTLF